MANELAVTIQIDDGTAIRTLKTFESKAEESGKKAGEGLAKGTELGFGSIFKANLLANLAADVIKKGLSSLSGFMKSTIDESMQAERAISSFGAALRASGNYSTQAVEGFSNYASTLERLTGIQNDVIVQNAAMLAGVGRLSGEGLNKASQAALNLSAGLQMSVESGFDMMAKAANGNVAALSRWGIKVNENLGPADRFNEALKQIEIRFGGMAAARMNTFEGSLTGLKNAFDNIKEAIGGAVTQSPFLVEVIKTIAKWISTLSKNITDFSKGRDVIFDLTMQFLKFAETLAIAIGPTIEILLRVFDVLLNKIGQVGGTLLALVSGNLAAVQEGLKSVFSLEGIDLATPIGNKMLETVLMMQGRAVELQEAAKPLGTAIGSGIREGITSELSKAQDQIKSIIGGTMLNIISGGFQRLGAALIKGAASFEDFKNFVLNAMGDMCIRLGEMMVAQSAAFAALQALIMNPLTAAVGSLGFGLALIALGGLMKAAAGGSGGGAQTTPIGGGGVTTTATGEGSPEATSLAETQQKQQTQLVVNVQGNVFDKRETGLYIADILQETLLTNGVLTTA